VPHTVTLWVKLTFLIYSDKAVCFTFLKPSLSHQNLHHGNYANIYSSVFFSSNEISHLTLYTSQVPTTNIQGVSGGIVNILGGGSTDYSE